MIECCFADGLDFGYGMIFCKFFFEIFTDGMLDIMVEDNFELTTFELNRLNGYNEGATGQE